MKLPLLGATIALALAACTPAAPPVVETPAPATPVPYGANAEASSTFVHDGVTFYYETYGEGEPLLLVHGNGGSIGSMAAQIDYFKATRRVIAMDSRDQGRSSDSDTPITYEKMTDDLSALLDHLHPGPVDVVGWSDGGIEALLLALRHPEQVRKIVTMAANLNPGPDAVYPETEDLVKRSLASMSAEVAASPEGKRFTKSAQMMLKEPNIDPAALAKITAPTLILSSDHDLIRLEHTLTIFNALPNASMGVFPDSTHMVPYDSPEMFNAVVDRFLKSPFQKKDRIKDVVRSLKKMAGDQPK